MSLVEESQEQWPPDYVKLFAWRQQQLIQFVQDPKLLEGAKEFYRTKPAEFIEDWCDTYDPRNAGKEGMMTRMPFILFRRQKEMIEFLMALLEGDENGLIEKCRDMGATWVACAFSIWLWLFWPDVTIGWGSRKEILVDRMGVIDSIFEKLRALVDGLPKEFLPEGYVRKAHAGYMRLINPANGSVIVGEAGDNIGRGGRTRIFFKDESAFYERPEMIQAALDDNTRVQVDISSVNGSGNVFHNRRKAGVEWIPGKPVVSDKTNVFVMDWRDHPAKDNDWYVKRKKKARDDGLEHLFASEVDRKYEASTLGILIKPEWVQAALGLFEDYGIETSGKKKGGLDVADDTVAGDNNTFIYMHGNQVEGAWSWGGMDTHETAGIAVGKCREKSCQEMHYDAIGVGAGITGAVNDLEREKELPQGLEIFAWIASGKIDEPYEYVDPPKEGDTLNHEGPLNRDFFMNWKAQAWWRVRKMFFKAWLIRQGKSKDFENAISISREIDPDQLRQLLSELSQPIRKNTTSGKMTVDKSPGVTRSPNLADGTVICACPMVENVVESGDLVYG